MTIKQARKNYTRAWKAWRKACAIRSAMASLGYGRNGAAKRWYVETRVRLTMAEREVRRCLSRAI